MNFVAPFFMCNTTLSDAKQFLAIVAAEGGPTNGALFANPVGGPDTNDGDLVPEAQFTAEGVPALVPAYFSVQFPGNTKYPLSYTVGICLWRISNQGADPLSTLD